MTREQAIGFELIFGVEASVVQDPSDLENWGISLTDQATYWTLEGAAEELVSECDGVVDWT